MATKKKTAEDNGNGDNDEPKEAPAPEILDSPIAKPAAAQEEVEFADPDITKPVINMLNGRPVEVLIVAPEKFVPNDADPEPALIFVQNGVSTDLLTKKAAADSRKFLQDKDGQIYYNPQGFMEIPGDFKALDLEKV